ncbi:unnamed protein product [Alternaria alternata]
MFTYNDISASRATPYSVAPLDPGGREFRLIELWPSTEAESIKCVLRSYSMDDHYPAYVALSYTWGRKERYDDISLNGIRFSVGKNLWQFLHHMRMRDERIILWIDAICINQSNVEERNHQVQMMRQIYSNAQSVSVWLGEADSWYSNVAMDYLAAQKALADKNHKPGRFWNQRQAKGVLALCERDYWRRIWIVQEIMLAREATIYCGSKCVSWQKFEEFVNKLQALYDKARGKRTLDVCSILDSPAIVIAKAKSEWDRNPQPLTRLLQLYRDHEATDIRDKIYALHGLAEDSLDIAVDYHKSIEDLHVEVLYYVCASRELSCGREWAARELVSFGKLIAGMLSIYCSEDEIKFHICMASRGAREMPSMRSSSPSTPTYVHQYSDASTDSPSLYSYPEDKLSGTSIIIGSASRLQAVRLSDEVTHIPELQQSRFRTPRYECSFSFLSCSYVSLNAEKWKTHCQSHFRGREPPQTVDCPLCDFQYTSADGWAAWDRRVEHFKVSHHDRDQTTLRFSRPEFSLFKHLWQKRLNDDH